MHEVSEITFPSRQKKKRAGTRIPTARLSTRKKSITIWKKHPVPGMPMPMPTLLEPNGFTQTAGPCAGDADPR